jgi:hypothetical protein
MMSPYGEYASHAGKARFPASTRMHTPTRPGTHTRVPIYARARARAHTHTQTSNIYCVFTATMIRERASVRRYTYIACLVSVFRFVVNYDVKFVSIFYDSQGRDLDIRKVFVVQMTKPAWHSEDVQLCL